MEKKLVIYGTTSFSEELCFYIERQGCGEVFAYVLDAFYLKLPRFCGKAVIAYEELGSYFLKDEMEVLISVGYSKMNNARKKLFEKCQKDGWKIASFVHSSANILADSIGVGNIIMDRADLKYHTKIGNGNIICANTIISHESMVGDFNYFAGSNHINGQCRIGSNNFLGTNCMIADHRSIGNYNLIGAGVCLNKSIGDDTVVAPAAVRERKSNVRAMNLLLMQSGK